MTPQRPRGYNPALARVPRALTFSLGSPLGFTMANIKSAKKRARQTPKRTAVNRNRVTRIRTFVKAVEEAIASGDKSAASAALRAAQPEMMRGTTKGVVSKRTVSRKLSRLSARVKSLS